MIIKKKTQIKIHKTVTLKPNRVQVEQQRGMLVGWVGGEAAETVDSLADDQIMDCVAHLVR